MAQWVEWPHLTPVMRGLNPSIDYLKKYARKKLHLANNGAYVILVPKTETEEQTHEDRHQPRD